MYIKVNRRKNPKDVKRVPKTTIVIFLLSFVIIVMVGVMLLTLALVPSLVIGTSMEPTFNNYDFIWVNTVAYGELSPVRGDYVVFSSKKGLELSRSINPDTRIGHYVKRVVGVRGDRVEIEGNKLKINGEILEEDYIQGSTVGEVDITVSEGNVFVLGDNRENSLDSRELGEIDINKIEGKVVFRLFPLKGIGAIN